MGHNGTASLMFMAICTPSDPRDEFIVTDNCYHIFEGPNHVQLRPEAAKTDDGAWTSFHEFAPISPKLRLSCGASSSHRDKSSSQLKQKKTET